MPPNSRDAAGTYVDWSPAFYFNRDVIMLTPFQFIEVRFASFLSGESITAIVVNPSERKLEKRTSVQLGGSD